VKTLAHETPDSSALRRVEWREQDNSLVVHFRRSASTSVYRDVPREVFEDLKRARSVGEFLNKTVKPNYRQAL